MNASECTFGISFKDARETKQNETSIWGVQKWGKRKKKIAKAFVLQKQIRRHHKINKSEY